MESPYSVKSFLMGAILSSVFLGALNTYVVRQYGFSNITALKDAAVSVLFWLLGALVIGNTIRYYLPRQSRIIFFAGLVVTLTAIWTGLSGLLLHFAQKRIPNYGDFFELSLPVRVSFTLLLFTSVALLFAFLYNLHDQQLAEKRNAEAQQVARQAELNNLQEKLHPHFLFNSLNSINALVVRQPHQARLMVQQLSDFLRGTLKRDGDAWLSLEKELAYLGLYLDIEKVRFGHRLQTNIEVEEQAAPAFLPPFLLLPILENAIKFGLYDTLENIEIKITAKISGGLLVISVSNPFDPETSGKYSGTGFGLKSVNRRLYLLFGRTDLLKTSVQDNIFETTIIIPQSA